MSILMVPSYPDHPHVCGENVIITSNSVTFFGSPPRVWGKLPIWQRLPGYKGSPPRVWGKQNRSGICIAFQQDHPHVCGENYFDGWTIKSIDGSPPRVWGKPVAPPVVLTILRITPTCVGKTSISVGGLVTGNGSPPRVWGKHRPVSHTRRSVRITPTCVGKTFPMGSLQPSTPDHPHVCGENKSSLAWQMARNGSPPRVWGKLCCGTSPNLIFTDHPHVCGENLMEAIGTGAPYGSPPRVWGKLIPTYLAPPYDRITPTCVGKTGISKR